MILNPVKLKRAVIFIKYIASVVIFSATVLSVSSSLKVLGMVENVLEKTFTEKM